MPASLHIFDVLVRSQEKVQRSDNMPLRHPLLGRTVLGRRTQDRQLNDRASETGSGHKSGHNSRVRRDLFHIKKTKQIFKIKEIFNEIRNRRLRAGFIS